MPDDRALALSDNPPASRIEADVLVLGVRKTDDGPQLVSQDPAFTELQIALESIGVTGGHDEVRRLPGAHTSAESIALVGLGTGDVTVDDLRYAAGSASRQVRGVASLVFALPTTTREEAFAVLEGAAIGAYAYTAYRAGFARSDEIAGIIHHGGQRDG